MSVQVGGRNLPPLVVNGQQKDSAGSSDGSRKPRRKKKPLGAEPGDSTPQSIRDRSSSRTRTLPQPVPDADVDEVFDDSIASKAARRKMQRTRFDESQPQEGEERTAVSVDKPKIKKKRKPVGTSREALMSEGDTEAESTEGQKPKKKKEKKKPLVEPPEEFGLAAELAELHDDVEEAEEEDDNEENAMPTSLPAGMHSQAISKVFVERKSGFKGTDLQKLAKAEAERQIRAMETANLVVEQKTTIQFGLLTHHIFKTICLFVQGLLAGFSLWHMASVWVISSHNDEALTLLQVYQPMALPVQAAFYCMLVLSTVAVLDRYDLSHLTRRFVVRAFSLQNGAVAALFYFLALVVSLSMAFLEDKINLFVAYPELWENPEKRDKDIHTWRILCLVRGIASILGWLIISLRPSTDRLTKNLQRADSNLLGIADPTVETVRSSGV